VTTETKHSFYVVDLVRNKPKTRLIQIPTARVEVDMTITTKNKKSPVAPTKLKRLESAALAKLEAAEKDIIALAKEGEKEAVSLMGVPSKSNLAAVENKIKDVNAKINKRIDTAKSAAEKAVNDLLKSEAKKDDLLVEAKVKFVWRIGKSFTKIGASVAKLVGTAGAEVTSYITIGTELYNLYGEYRKAVKSEETKRKELNEALAAYDGESSSEKKLEKCRIAYRDSTTALRKKTDAIAVKGQKLFVLAKSKGTIQEGVKIGAQAMSIKAKATKLSQSYDVRLVFLTKIESVMKDAGLNVIDKTLIDKLKALDTKTIIATVTEMKDSVETVYGLVKEIKALA
jgi:hypothetical protein